MANFQYEFSVTGDCSNNGSGAIYISLSGGVEPYTIDWVSPNIGTGSTKTGLDAGVYIVRANDALGDVNNEFYINIIVSSGGCLSVSSVSATTCGQNNGSLNVQVGTGYTGVLDYLLSNDTQIIDTSLTGVTFTGLSSGSYTVTVVDVDSCSIVRSFTINDSDGATFDLIPTSCGTGNQGSITGWFRKWRLWPYIW